MLIIVNLLHVAFSSGPQQTKIKEGVMAKQQLLGSKVFSTLAFDVPDPRRRAVDVSYDRCEENTVKRGERAARGNVGTWECGNVRTWERENVRT
jgi:hypothetical protein